MTECGQRAATTCWRSPVGVPEAAVAEAARNALAHRATTGVLMLVTMAMTAVTLLTAGRAAAAEAEVLRSVDDAGPRLITLTVEEPSPGLSENALRRIASIKELEWVLGLGGARDVRSDSTGQNANVAVRNLVTDLPDEVTIELGRPPLSGEALIGSQPQQRLRMLQPSGSLLDAGDKRAVVGRFSSSGVIADLDRLVLVQPEDVRNEHATLVYALARDANQVASAVLQIRALAGIGAEQLNVQTSPELVELSRVLAGEVGALSRQLALGSIVVGVVLVALTMTLALSNRRRDFGRQRALGASRSALLASVLIQAAIPVILGVTLGTTAGAVAVWFWGGVLPPHSFIAGTAALIAATGISAAVPPAAFAAIQDPLRILRVP
jgi:putative ABC transport system permease protein